jgi:hypothetical protein
MRPEMDILTKEVFVAWTNTDLTEGRGRQIPKYVCTARKTAERLGHKGYVQGCDCPVTKEVAVKYNELWLVPGVIVLPTKEDLKRQEEEDAFYEVLSKAKSAGLSEKDIEILSKKKASND